MNSLLFFSVVAMNFVMALILLWLGQFAWMANTLPWKILSVFSRLLGIGFIVLGVLLIIQERW